MGRINENCSDDTEKRPLLVAMDNDHAYVVQAVVTYFLSTVGVQFVDERLMSLKASNLVWRMTAFPPARKGYRWSIVLQTQFSMLAIDQGI